MEQVLGSLGDVGAPIAAFLPTLAAALGILVGGWIVALLAAALVRGALRRTSLDEKIVASLGGHGEGSPAFDSAKAGGKLTFWTVMLFALMGFFQVLNLTVVTEPLSAALGVFTAYAPRVLGALALVALAWFVASVARRLIGMILDGSGLAARLDRMSGDVEAGTATATVSTSLGEAVYWLVWFLFLPGILGALAVEGLLRPVQNVVDQLLGFAPKLLGAAVIFAIGWFVARLVRNVLSNLLRAVGTDSLGERVGIASTHSLGGLSGLIGLVAYVLILVPVVVSALGALEMDAITDPATAMLGRMLEVLPSMFAAAVLLGLAFLVGRLVAELAQTALEGLGFDRMMSSIGLIRDPVAGTTASGLAARALHFGVMLFASMEAASLLGFGSLNSLLEQVAVFAGQLVLGVVIMAVALYLGGLAHDAIRGMNSALAPQLALAARVAILALAGAMALQQMNVGGEIITLAFGSTIGAVAVASAIAFGFGGREVARQYLERWTGTGSSVRASSSARMTPGTVE